MGIKKCNTTDAIWVLGSRCSDHFGGRGVSTNAFNVNVISHLLSTIDILCLLDATKIGDFSGSRICIPSPVTSTAIG